MQAPTHSVKTLDIVIVNWNSGCQLREALSALANIERSSFHLQRVVVVDNASTDSSAEIRDDLRLPLQIVSNELNIGFARACNQGARGSQAELLLFLNPDTRVSRDAIRLAIAHLDDHQNRGHGIVGAQMVNSDGTIARSCARFPTAWTFISRSAGLTQMFPKRFPDVTLSDWNHSESREVDHVIGAFYLVRRHLFQRLNGFDERFFVYLEDLDFSRRAQELGWKVYYLDHAKVYHKGGGTSSQAKARRLFYSLRSKIFYSLKHHSCFGSSMVLVSSIFVEPVSRSLPALMRLDVPRLSDTIIAYALLLRSLPECLATGLRARREALPHH